MWFSCDKSAVLDCMATISIFLFISEVPLADILTITNLMDRRLPDVYKLWNELWSAVFQKRYNMGTFKKGVNRFLSYKRGR